MAEQTLRDERGFTPLYEQQDHTYSDDTWEGAGVFSSWSDLGAARADPQLSGVGLAANYAAAGLDTLGAVMNPLDSLASAGIGWLIEHVSFLHEGLDYLAGDPIQIQNNARTWESVGLRLRDVAEQYEGSLRSLVEWEGLAADSYREATGVFTDALRSNAEEVDQAAAQILDSGATVGTFRAVVRDIIADVLGSLISQAIAAGLLALVTAGISVGGFIASAVITAVNTARKIADIISKLLDLLSAASKSLSDLLKRISSVSGRLATKADELAARATDTRKYGDDLGKALEGPSTRVPDSVQPPTRAPANAEPGPLEKALSDAFDGRPKKTVIEAAKQFTSDDYRPDPKHPVGAAPEVVRPTQMPEDWRSRITEVLG
jgi:hypothetical protein